jgi:large conductance mechanosensitive channel
MKSTGTELRDFLLKGNVMALAIGVAIGAAFGAVVASMVADVITPLIAAIFGTPDFSSYKFTINGSDIMYGNFLNALLAFIITGVGIFFLVVKPMMAATRRFAKEEATTTKKCPECLSEIPLDARRCAQCAVVLEPAIA